MSELELAAGYPVVVVDSMSHEWEGDGGLMVCMNCEAEQWADVLGIALDEQHAEPDEDDDYPERRYGN